VYTCIFLYKVCPLPLLVATKGQGGVEVVKTVNPDSSRAQIARNGVDGVDVGRPHTSSEPVVALFLCVYLCVCVCVFVLY